MNKRSSKPDSAYKMYKVAAPNRRAILVGLAASALSGCGQAAKPRAVQAAQRSADPKPLLELVTLEPGIRLDLRYATANNFTGRVLYAQARAFLQRDAARALVRAHRAAVVEGFGLTIFDAYRPWRVTKALWDATPRGPKRNYVANPKKGSRHNRGCAVDLSLHDLKSGQLVAMPSEFDDFSERAHRDYMAASEVAIANRARLERLMEAEGFRGMSNEWWHFDFNGWEAHPILDLPFEAL